MQNEILSLEEETRKKFNNLKKYYDQTWDLEDHTLHVGLFEEGTKSLEEAYNNATDHLIKKINEASRINKNSVILDVGCGSGRTLIEICKEYGCSGIGIDLSDEMIKDAEEHLKKINEKFNPKIKVNFIRGSASDLNKLLKNNNQFTHIISQDSLFLVADKDSLYKNLYGLLKKRGVLGINDFLGQDHEELGQKQKELIYQVVNWSRSLSFEGYLEILKSLGFIIISSEKRNQDMIKTYQLLAKRMQKYVESEDQTYRTLKERYSSIAKAVKNHKMGWGTFVAKK